MFEYGEDVVVAPALVTEIGPQIVVTWISTRKQHIIDGCFAAKGTTCRQMATVLNHAQTGRVLGDGVEVPTVRGGL